MKPQWFNKYYRCPCGTEWQDEWDCLCNDRCPTCDTECEPYDHAEIDEGKPVDVPNYPLQSRDMTWVMFIRKDWLNATDLEHFTRQKERSDYPDGESGVLHSTTDPS